MRTLATVAALVVLVAACGGDNGENGELLPADEREPAPDVEAETVDGEVIALADLEGPVVVNFWGSWCGPCIEEAPTLARLHDAYTDEGVSFIGVNVRDSERGAERFAEEVGKPFPSWFDQPGEIAASFGGIGPAVMPSTLLLDGQHRVAARFFGRVDYGQVQARLDPLVAEHAGEIDDAATWVER